MRTPQKSSGFEITRDAALSAAKSGRLLTMEIEPSLRCNFKCPYCYTAGADAHPDELSLDELRDVIRQAKALGAERIIILGGEPSIYPNIIELIGFIRSEGLEAEMFTNGSGITEPFSRFLFENRVRVVLKLNSLDRGLQDRLAGKKGAFGIIQSALSVLKQVGYPSETAFLAASTVICRPNLAELPFLWQWLRDQGIEPYFEMITPQERALRNPWLDVTPLDAKELFERISEIDRTHYDRVWEPQPPLVGNRCLRHLFSCLVTARGEVMPCVGLTVSLGNIRHRPLANILAESELLNTLKRFPGAIKDPCGTCEKSDVCQGCRGAAYQLTGDPLASDPLCWRNQGKNI